MNKSAIADLIPHAAVRGECKTGKRGLPDEATAVRAADNYNEQHRRRRPRSGPRKEAEAYHCWHCGRWHIGRPRG